MGVEQLTINSIRILSAEAIQKANSGHPGLPMGAAPMAYEIFAKHMKHNPKNPNWVNRDRFILSAGHGSMLLYSLLHLFGYGLSIEDLKNFRQWGSKTPGHPEFGHTVGVETTTGPLGQGLANAVGMAMAEAHLAAKFNQEDMKLVDHYTYALAGDGCMMEGITSEACSLAGTLKLGKLIAFYDSNKITIEGDTDIAFTEDVAKRYEAYNWQVIKVDDGNDLEQINKAIVEAKACKERPSLIIVKTQIGFGCPAKQGKASAHGEPLGGDNLLDTKKNLGWPTDKDFYVPEEVYTHMEEVIQKGAKSEEEWNTLFKAFEEKYPKLAKEWHVWHDKELPINLLEDEDYWSYDDKAIATRAASGQIMNKIANRVPNLIGGSADLSPSTKTIMEGKGDFSADNYKGANLHFGVREHAMAAIANGMSLHGGLRAYVSTFFVFCDYMKHSMRLSALMKQPVTYVLTHDSIGVGEDGPTHQPVEHLASLRTIPNFTVYRPADATETAAGWYLAMTKADGPVGLVLTRQNLPQYEGSSKEALKGGYILEDSDKDQPDAILMASGSEVELIHEAKKVLKEEGIDVRVISMPSMDLFDEQDSSYRETILPNNVRARLAVEAGCSTNWYKYVGLDGDVISIDTFGASAPASKVFKEYGFTVENVVEKVKAMML